jgi:cation diffusion facilitator CzcD-associated flavoprotein CzcO
VGTVEAVESAVGTMEGRAMARTLRLRGGSTIQFDFCVLCTGASYAAPIKSPMEAAATVEQRRRQYKDTHEQLAAAQSVVVVGGGFVGVELAAEIVRAETIAATLSRPARPRGTDGVYNGTHEGLFRCCGHRLPRRHRVVVRPHA